MTEIKDKKYIIDFPALMEEWDYEKNNELGFYPDKLTHATPKKAWWICKKGHRYQASVSKRTIGRDCPYCANRKVLVGYNDLATLYPNIANEWNYEKNYPLLPTQVVSGSSRKIWWKCSKGHEYSMPIGDRKQGNNCPICSNRQILKGYNDLATTHPHLLNEWDYEKNSVLDIFPDNITKGSTKSVWWKCNKCGYEWKTNPNARTGSSKTKCPCCSRKRVVTGINDLETLYPHIAKRWHPTKNDKKANQVAPFSNKKAWWICEKDNRHIFFSLIYQVVSNNTMCPICANQKIIAGINDFQTTCPDLMKEWNWSKNDILQIYPTKITKGINRKVWWICEKGHEWQATVGSRAGDQKCGCPVCKKDLSSSFPEKAIAFYLSQYFVVEENKKFSWLKQSEIDIYLRELKIGIEYDGKIWHKNIDKDINKDNLCKENGITLIRVREKGCPEYESNAFKVLRKNTQTLELDKCISEIFQIISNLTSQNICCDVNTNNDYIKILEKISTGKREKSIAKTELIRSWNYNRNGKINPESISIGSHKKVWWICEKGHEWQATVSSRAGNQKCGCPYCAGQKVKTGDNDLATLYPHIAKEWDKTKNIKTASQVRPMDNRKYWWICAKCGKSYLSSPSHRVGNNRGCPDCGRLKTISSHFKKIINLDTEEIFNSIKDASTKMNIHQGSISNCCRGVRKTAGGYRWKFYDEK